MYFLLGLFSSTALYGVLAFAGVVFGLDTSVSTILDGAADPTNLTRSFYWFAAISLVAYPMLKLIQFLMVKAGIRRRGSSPYRGSVLAASPAWVAADFTNPLRGLLSLKGAAKVIDGSGRQRAVSWGTEILHLGWSLTLIAWLGLGFAELALKR